MGSHEAFFRSTPRLMALLVEGRKRRAEAEHNARAWAVWHIAALPKMKRMPPLKDLEAKNKRKPKRRIMTADAMLTLAQMWSSVAGPQGE